MFTPFIGALHMYNNYRDSLKPAEPDLPDGAPCWEMGDHFPWVCKGGLPVQIQPPKQPNANSPLFEGETGDETWNGSRMWSRKE